MLKHMLWINFWDFKCDAYFFSMKKDKPLPVMKYNKLLFVCSNISAINTCHPPASPVFKTGESVRLPFNLKGWQTSSPVIKISMLACRASEFLRACSNVDSNHD